MAASGAKSGEATQNSGEVFSLIIGEMDAWTDGHEEAGAGSRLMSLQNMCTRYNQTEHSPEFCICLPTKLHENTSMAKASATLCVSER